jgi:molybdopterin-containing oxidoreductase family iron-sulfur binding subunit
MKEEMMCGTVALYRVCDLQSVTTGKASEWNMSLLVFKVKKTLMGRGDIIKETTLEIFNTKDAKVWNEVPMVSLNHEELKVHC